MRPRQILGPLALSLAGLLTGNELGTLVVIHPALAGLPMPSHLLAEQSVTRRYGRFMPFLMTATASAAVTAAVSSTRRSRWLFIGAASCYGAMLGVTLVGNVPLNSATLRLTEQTSEKELTHIRRRWYRLHLLRVGLDLSGLILVALAIPGRGRRA